MSDEAKVLCQEATAEYVQAAKAVAIPEWAQRSHDGKLDALHQSHEELRRRLAAGHRGFRKLNRLVVAVLESWAENGFLSKEPMMSAHVVEAIIKEALSSMGTPEDVGVVDPTVG